MDVNTLLPYVSYAVPVGIILISVVLVYVVGFKKAEQPPFAHLSGVVDADAKNKSKKKSKNKDKVRFLSLFFFLTKPVILPLLSSFTRWLIYLVQVRVRSTRDNLRSARLILESIWIVFIGALKSNSVIIIGKILQLLLELIIEILFVIIWSTYTPNYLGSMFFVLIF